MIKDHNTSKKLFFVLACLCFILPKPAQAVIPPDFIFSIGSQIVQFFSMIMLFLTALLGAIFQFIQTKFYTIKHRKTVLGFCFLGIILVALAGSYAYAAYRQKAEYQKWLAESRLYGPARPDTILPESPPPTPPPLTALANAASTSPDMNDIALIDMTGENDFFEKNKNTNLVLSNDDFRKITDNPSAVYLILDARENVEYENGHFPDSLHIRFADLLAGGWTDLPTDKAIYVICWSGIRGREVTEFLRSQQLAASYLENGANGWVESGGLWSGNIKFADTYSAKRYQLVFDTPEVKEQVKQGAFLVDTREPERFAHNHIAGSVNIPIMYTPTTDLESVFAQVPALSRVITVCDGYVNCFDAKITGVELEKRGHKFLGRYNKPWDYGQ